MPTVEQLVNTILRHEGGYVNHPADRGGPTNMGVTLRTLSRWLGRPATLQELKGLTAETVKDIYLGDYFHGPRIDTLPPVIHPVMFDMSVNHGPRNAVKMLQRVINQAGLHQIAEDGAIGPITRRWAFATMQHLGVEGLINSIVHERVNFYHLIVARRPDQGVFLRGWLKRAESFRP